MHDDSNLDADNQYATKTYHIYSLNFLSGVKFLDLSTYESVIIKNSNFHMLRSFHCIFLVFIYVTLSNLFTS